MNALHRTEFRTLSNRQLQARLERQLAARKAAQSVIDARIATRRSQFRSDAKSALAYRPMTRVSDVQPMDSDPPLRWMLMWAAVALPCWALFGWGVVGLIRFFGGAA